jgi:hypothetical protein
VCEVHGSRQPEVLKLHRPFSDVALVDLLERPLDTVDYSSRSGTLSLRPFELQTLRFRP